MDEKINLSHLLLFRLEIKIKNRFFATLLLEVLRGQIKKGVPEGTPKDLILSKR